MKLARFSVGPWESYGLVEGDQVRVIQAAFSGNTPLPTRPIPSAR